MAGTKAEPELRRISIATVRSQSEAQAISRKIKKVGIECYIVQERSIGTALSERRHFAAIKVQVRSVDVARAIQQLQTKETPVLMAPVVEPAVQPGGSLLSTEPKPAPAFLPAGILLLVGVGLALLLIL